MSEVHDANEVSAILDGGPTGQRVPFRLRGQEQVHNALSNRKGIVWSKPSAGLCDSIMLRASLKTPESTRRWPLGLAASVALAAATTWIMMGRGTPPVVSPSPVTPHVEIAKVETPSRISLENIIAKMEQPAGMVMAANVERGLINEARALGEETQRGVQAVLAKLPMMPAFGLGQ